MTLLLEAAVIEFRERIDAHVSAIVVELADQVVKLGRLLSPAPELPPARRRVKRVGAKNFARNFSGRRFL